jgi:5'-phosphate synthase pdxT subunit
VRVGVIALQGATAAHAAALERLGAEPVQIRTPADLDGIDAVVLPGGESTTISFLLDSNRLRAPLADRLSAGLPTLGTCAGMILLASEVLDGRSDQRSFGAIDLAVRRNGFGRQLDSFEADLAVTGLDEPFHAVFIRAPVVERVGEGVEVLAEVDGRAVLCRRGPVLVSSFHPELTDDLRLHELFLESINSEVTRS